MCSLREKSLTVLVVGLISFSNYSNAFQPTSLQTSLLSSSTKQHYPQHYNYHSKSTLLNALPNSNSNYNYNDSTNNPSSSSSSPSFANAVRNGWQPERGSFSGLKRRHRDGKMNSIRSMADTSGAIMPDGGLSPCIIKVVGVGGGGCNAVSRQ